MGFTPKHQADNHGRWSFGQIRYVFRYCCVIFSCSEFVLVEANSLDEYVVSIFELCVAVALLIAFISIIFKNDKLFEVIEQCGTELTTRADENPLSQAMHERTAHLLERMSEIVYFAFVMFTVGLQLPIAIKSYFIYYTTDAGSDAFYLPILVW